MVRDVWIGVLTPRNTLTIGHNKRVLDTSIKYLYAYKRTIDTIENLCVMSLARFPESVQLRQLCWRHAAGLLTYRSFVQPSQFIENQ